MFLSLLPYGNEVLLEAGDPVEFITKVIGVEIACLRKLLNL